LGWRIRIGGSSVHDEPRMNWSQARRKLLRLATGGGVLSPPPHRVVAPLRVAAPRRRGPRSLVTPPSPIDRPGVVRAASLCVASGKGGTGKTVVSASLATLFSLRGRTLILDADFGVGNAHILQDVSPPRSFVDVIGGEVGLRQVLMPCSAQLDLLAAGSGVPCMTELSDFELHVIASGLEELESDYRFLIADSAAGVSPQTVHFARSCDVVLVVTTPDLTAMTDAYAFLKVLHGRRPDCRPLLIVNRAHDEEEALDTSERVSRVCRRFLGKAPQLVGWVPDDPEVTRCVNRQGPVVALAPDAPASRALRRIAVRVLGELSSRHSRGLGRGLLVDLGYATRVS
jgi:flagellar biosynthesis protein FlhG